MNASQEQSTNPIERPAMTHCSYCGNQGHNVLRCDHIDLDKFRILCFGNRMVFDVETENEISSREIFKTWLCCMWSDNSQLVVSFASRYCKIPLYRNFIDRIDMITTQVYRISSETLREIVNPNNDRLINLALSNRPHLVGMNFDDRITYLNELVAYLSNSIENLEPQLPRKFNISTTVLPEKEKEEEEECQICYETKTSHNYIAYNCDHKFCGDCVVSILKTTTKSDPTCSLCRAVIHNVTIHDNALLEQIKEYIL